jgi:hypothetical protein
MLMYDLSTAPFSSSSTWNTQISQGATYGKLNWPTSTGYNYIVSWDKYSPSVYVASDSDPIVKVNVPAGWGYPGGTLSVRMPAGADGAAGTDGELVVIDGDNVYNFWQFDRTSSTTATASCYGIENIKTGDGWGSKSPFLGAGTTAVGSSQMAGLIVQSETRDGDIDHALQIVLDYALTKPGFTGSAISGDGGNTNGLVQEGAHLAISPNTAMPSGLSDLGKQVFTALQKYGGYVVDVAGGCSTVRAQANGFDSSTITALSQDMGKLMPLLQTVSGGTTGGGATSGGTTGGGTTGGGTTSGGTTSGGTTGGGTTSGGTTGGGTTSGGTTGGGTTSGGTTGGDTTGGGTTTGQQPPWQSSGSGHDWGRNHGRRGSYASWSSNYGSGGSWYRTKRYGSNLQADPTNTGTTATSPLKATASATGGTGITKDVGSSAADAISLKGQQIANGASSVLGGGVPVANGFAGGGLASLMGGRNVATLAIGGCSSNAGANSAVSDVQASRTALLNQFAAGSFATPAASFGDTPFRNPASQNLAQTLTQPRQA